MSIKRDELEVEVLNLPAEQRADLARRLIESLDDKEDGDFEAEWIEEAERRYAEYRTVLTRCRPGAVVIREANALLK